MKNDIVNKICINVKILLTVNDNFKKELDEAHKVAIENNLFGEPQKSSYQVYIGQTKEQKNKINTIINTIREKYNLSEAYHKILEAYLIGGDMGDYLFLASSRPFDPFCVSNPQNKDEQIVVLVLSPELSITELQENWKEITKKRDYYLKEIDKYKKTKQLYPRKNLNRDIEIFNLVKQKMKYKEIAGIINKKYPETFLGYEDISKIVDRLKAKAREIIRDK